MRLLDVSYGALWPDDDLGPYDVGVYDAFRVTADDWIEPTDLIASDVTGSGENVGKT